MDDRFRSEESGYKVGPDRPKQPQISKANLLGDFSENIDSTSGKSMSDAPTVIGAAKAKRFQVNLPEEANLIPDFSSPQQTAKPSVLQEVSGEEYLASIRNRTSDRSAGASAVKSEQSADSVASGAVQKKASPAVVGKSQQNTRIIPVVRTPKTKNGAAKPSAPVIQNRNTPKKPLTQEQARKLRAKKKYNFINSVLVACVCLIFITILTVTASTVAMTTINDILVIDKGDNAGSVSVYIEPESDYDEVFGALKDAGLIKQPLITDIFCKFRHYDEIEVYEDGKYVETKRISYEAGTYYLDADMGVEAMLESMMSSRLNSSETVRLTFPEGWTIAQIFEKIEKYRVCEADKLYANLDIIGSQYGFIESIGTVNGRYLKAEGYLFPDTYDFFIGENASSVIKKLFNNFDAKWKDEYNDRLKELNMTVDEIITIASIIQREAANSSQMGAVSSVIHNRLADKATYPFINMDSTSNYISVLAKDFDVLNDFYEKLYAASYNTYSNTGLPPGPICNPGAAAIRAALYPDDTKYYYFCHDDSGNIYLAATKSEHDANYMKVLYGH